MKESAEGLAADLPVAPAANENFVSGIDGFDPRTEQRSGWDPYEVWRTRVKAPLVKAPVVKAAVAKAAVDQTPALAPPEHGGDPLTEPLS